MPLSLASMAARLMRQDAGGSPGNGNADTSRCGVMMNPMTSDQPNDPFLLSGRDPRQFMKDEIDQAETREFSFGDVLTAATGHLFCPDGFKGLYEMCEFMFQAPVMTHQLSPALRVIGPYVLSQYPELAQIDVSLAIGDRDAWMDDKTNIYGERLVLIALPPNLRQSVALDSLVAHKPAVVVKTAA